MAGPATYRDGCESAFEMTMQMLQMDDGALVRTWTIGTPDANRLPVLMVHGGPGLPDYLEPVSNLIEDLCRVHRYDQRGTGGSPWSGEHTVARHVRDLQLLLDAWKYERVVLLGHSYGTDLASFFLLAHPERVAGMIYLCGPFLGAWRETTHAVERKRRSGPNQTRLELLKAITPRTNEEEIEYLTLSWFTDHADRQRAWEWAKASAQALRPVNYQMNAQLNADKKVDPLEAQIDRLIEVLPVGTVIIGGEGDPRPAALLRQLAEQLNCEINIIPNAGHQPWLEEPEQFRTALRRAVSRKREAK